MQRDARDTRNVFVWPLRHAMEFFETQQAASLPAYGVAPHKKHHHSMTVEVFDWLGYKDSNLNSLLQRQVYYHYTIPQQCWCR